jgi:hypothetical protein
MEEAISNLRQFLYVFRKKYLRPQKKAVRVNSFVPGLPAGITQDVLNSICREQFGEKPNSFSSQHLSGWKPSGAYRIHIQTERGNQISLIYKEAFYTLEQIPALVNLPIQPGQSEFAIFSQPVGALAPYLPRVYLAEELAPGIHYQYILEDLEQEYHKIHDEEGLLRSSEMLPRLHYAMKEWANEFKPAQFIQYGASVSQALQEYAQVSLENYSHLSDDPVLKTVLACWPKISNAYLMPEIFERQPAMPIHGDSNYTNVFFHNQDHFRVKLVDWEWAGYGLPHADLASLLKSMSENLENRALRKFLGTQHNPNPCLNPDLTFEENQRIYYWCQLERGILDAAFLINQYLKSLHSAYFSMPNTITNSLIHILSAYKKLGG